MREPELGAFVFESVGGADDAELFLAAAEGVGDAGVDGSPDGLGIVVKGEFGEDEVGGVAANGFGLGGEGDETGAVGPFDLGGEETGAGFAGRADAGVGVEGLGALADGDMEGFGPALGFVDGFEGLAFAGGEDDPGGARVEAGVGDGLGGGGEVLAGLTGPEGDFEAGGIGKPEALVLEEAAAAYEFQVVSVHGVGSFRFRAPGRGPAWAAPGGANWI